MATFLEILIKRIEQLNDPKIRLVAAPPLPITVLLVHVDAHYNCYAKVQSIRVSTETIPFPQNQNITTIILS